MMFDDLMRQDKDIMVIQMDHLSGTPFNTLPERFVFTSSTGTKVSVVALKDRHVYAGDITLTSHPITSFSFQPTNRPIFNKITCQKMLGEALRTFTGFKEIPTAPLDKRTNTAILSEYNEFVIKPNSMARAVGSFYFKSDKETLVGLNQLLLTVGADRLIDDNIITLLPSSEFEKGESLSALKNNIRNLVVQPVINKVMEFRVLTDYRGRPFFTQKRVFRDGIVKTATGFSVGEFVGFDDDWDFASVLTLSCVPRHVIESITSAFERMCRSFNSFDLFITEEMEWGFFEFSSEWGTAGIDPKIVLSHMVNYLDGLYLDYVRGRVMEIPTYHKTISHHDNKKETGYVA